MYSKRPDLVILYISRMYKGVTLGVQVVYSTRPDLVILYIQWDVQGCHFRCPGSVQYEASSTTDTVGPFILFAFVPLSVWVYNLFWFSFVLTQLIQHKPSCSGTSSYSIIIFSSWKPGINRSLRYKNDILVYFKTPA